ncbi:hypothetical protein KHQ06_26850 [Nocardia tengchongensis]|uniref:DUF4254 domain-containing protein n=1 Tax=Nocardia tengchongensis TaxID=2055889 RepID=A0ABX8CLU9_9NOCA|nr:hypothetical protein [Nocardia tengchongensis]QVI19898.1 hypothetical protein KHQ06_26850 [Nocardia tengchongensis]
MNAGVAAFEDPATDSESLLSPEQLLAAIAGRLAEPFPLITWARELGDLHAALISAVLNPLRNAPEVTEAALCAEIAKVIDKINSWAASSVRHSRCARRHTHTFGEVISHVAKTYAEAWWTVLHSDCEDLRHSAWVHLGEVRDGYAHLISDIRAGRVQLPLGWRGIRPTQPGAGDHETSPSP